MSVVFRYILGRIHLYPSTDENYGEFLDVGFSSFLVRNSLLLWMSLYYVNQNNISSKYLHSFSTFICSSFHILFNVCHKNSVGGGLIRTEWYLNFPTWSLGDEIIQYYAYFSNVTGNGFIVGSGFCMFSKLGLGFSGFQILCMTNFSYQ